MDDGYAAELAGVSVRTPHYYDQVGLARPSSRNAAGYRLYTDADLAVLQRVVFYREFGLDLGDIADILANPDTTDEDHLRRQRELIEQRRRSTTVRTGEADATTTTWRQGCRSTSTTPSSPTANANPSDRSAGPSLVRG
jgi:DNA-binding transcriptional MerR regulator